MKKLLFIILLGLLNIPVFTQDTSTINGSSHLNQTEYSSLNCNGSLTFKDLTIQDSLVTNGSIKGKNLKCKTIKSNGSFDVDSLRAQSVESSGSFIAENIEISGSAEFFGGVEIKNGKLQNIQIAGTKPTLVDTKVNGNIHIKKVKSGCSFFGITFTKSAPQIITLKGNSLVAGDIIFEENGEVHLFDGAKINGKIVNAKVIQN